MSGIAILLVMLIAALHGAILWLEMFGWEEHGPKVFKSLDPELFPKTTVLAANQGLYNGFLAAGLLWSVVISDPDWARYLALFFLGCVAVAGLYGAYSASTTILYVQTVPAVVAMLLVKIS